MSQEINKGRLHSTTPASVSREDREMNVSPKPEDSPERTIDRKGQSEQAGGGRNWQDTPRRTLPSDWKNLPQRKTTYDPRTATPTPTLTPTLTPTHAKYQVNELRELAEAEIEDLLTSTACQVDEQDILTLSARFVASPQKKLLPTTKWGRFKQRVINFFKIFNFKNLRSRKVRTEASSIKQRTQEKIVKTLNKMISRRMKIYARQMKKYPTKIAVSKKFAEQFHGLSAAEHQGYLNQLDLLGTILKARQDGEEWGDPIMSATLSTLSAMDALFKIFDAKDIVQFRQRLLEDEQRQSEDWRQTHDY